MRENETGRKLGRRKIMREKEGGEESSMNILTYTHTHTQYKGQIKIIERMLKNSWLNQEWNFLTLIKSFYIVLNKEKLKNKVIQKEKFNLKKVNIITFQFK